MENSFFNANLMALGGQMAQAWQKTLEVWWQGLLGDRERLKDLARGLAEVAKEAKVAGEPGARAGAGAGPEDLARVVDALELIERRQKALEEQVAALADNLSAVVAYLEQSGATPAAAVVEKVGGAEEAT